MFSQPVPTAGSQPHHEDCTCAACGGDPWEGTWGPGDNAPAIHRTVLGATADAPAGAGSPAMDDTLTPVPAHDELTPAPPRVETDLPAELVGWLDYAKHAADNEKAWKAVKEAAIQKLKDWAVAHGVDAPTVAGEPAFSYKESAPGGQLDGAALKKDHPDIYAAYYKPKKPSRPFNFQGRWK